MAGYELITTAPRPRTAVFRGRGTAWRARPMAAAAATRPDYADGGTGGVFANGSG